MAASIVNTALERQADDDGALVRRILRHDQTAFELRMRRYNARLYRVARSVLKNDMDVEDVLQEA
jgi:RNA polymerase sigma-70 factor (ECF subfamily)